MFQDGAILLDVQRGVCFSLNPLGTQIWNAVKQGDTREGIIRSLCEDFLDVDRAEVTRDVDEFLSRLAESQILQVSA